jgi:hypothetical protein
MARGSRLGGFSFGAKPIEIGDGEVWFGFLDRIFAVFLGEEEIDRLAVIFSLVAPAETARLVDADLGECGEQPLFVDCRGLPDAIEENVSVLARPVLVKQPASERDVTAVSGLIASIPRHRASASAWVQLMPLPPSWVDEACPHPRS